MEKSQLPNGFVYLKDIAPDILQSVRYATNENFVGTQIDGYNAAEIVLTKDAAQACLKAHSKLLKQGYALVVYDGYRPIRAVEHFVRWSNDILNLEQKQKYYATQEKEDLFNLGYIAKESSHSRGSTVDVSMILKNQPLKEITLDVVELKNGEKIQFLNDGTVHMGTSFDCMHKASNHDSELVEQQYLNARQILRNAMTSSGFVEYNQEWWHYTLQNEPYTESFDFHIVLTNSAFCD